MVKFKFILCMILGALLVGSPALGQSTQPAAGDKSKSDADQEKRAADWVTELKLNDPARENAVREIIAAHLRAVRDWHNEHSYRLVPEGINPTTGKALSVQERQLIIDSTIPKSVHQALMEGLRKNLSNTQVEFILDKYTEGKVAFTMAGYKAIVSDLTIAEELTITEHLKAAREQAVDYKGSALISAIFKTQKTRCEQYLISNGRNWRALYKAYVDSVNAKKSAATQAVIEPGVE